MNIGIIGYGHLAKALASGWLQDPKTTLWVSAPSLTLGQHKERLYGHASNLEILPKVDYLILAVKPLQMAAILQEINPHLPPHLPLISVAAGLNVAWFKQRLPAQTPFIRAMPNLASGCGKGATALFADDAIEQSLKKNISALWSSCGIFTWVKQEQDIDTLTALSGSGLAYLFRFTDAMRQAGVEMGLTEEIANAFAKQSLIGAAALAQDSKDSLESLQSQISSKAGTTAAALSVFADQQLNAIVLAAMRSAFERSKSLLSGES